MKMNSSQRQFYESFASHGNGDAKVTIPPKDLALLVHMAYRDFHFDHPKGMSVAYFKAAKKSFFGISSVDLASLPEVSENDVFSFLTTAKVTVVGDPLYLYLQNLCVLYRRRLKFSGILETQPFPTWDQIGPRCLLEYGQCSNETLYTWMMWRKLLFDIDNRSAQETGYLFEPILASCLGGVSCPAKNSPVKRLDASGNQTSEGRQIDCYLQDQREVYELKLRVTIAASGQGRFEEEKSFPREAKAAGLTPVLVVFDPTSSDKLEELKRHYTDAGGNTYIGAEAWKKLIEKAGPAMGLFIDKYIKPPIVSVGSLDVPTVSNLSLSISGQQLVVKAKGCKPYTINRK